VLTYTRSVVQNESLVRWLLEQGADPTRGQPRWNENDPEDDRNAGAALNSAANACNVAVFDLLLKGGARIETSVPLHMAAKNRTAGAAGVLMMTHLLELGLDVNGLDDIQGPWRLGTPLHYAVRDRSIDAARFLLERGADPHKKNQWGYTPAEDALKSNATDFIRMFEVA
jgi:ankyrin repeat protein